MKKTLPESGLAKSIVRTEREKERERKKNRANGFEKLAVCPKIEHKARTEEDMVRATKEKPYFIWTLGKLP